jgi:hypothetical protein
LPSLSLLFLTQLGSCTTAALVNMTRDDVTNPKAEECRMQLIISGYLPVIHEKHAQLFDDHDIVDDLILGIPTLYTPPRAIPSTLAPNTADPTPHTLRLTPDTRRTLRSSLMAIRPLALSRPSPLIPLTPTLTHPQPLSGPSRPTPHADPQCTRRWRRRQLSIQPSSPLRLRLPPDRSPATPHPPPPCTLHHR